MPRDKASGIYSDSRTATGASRQVCYSLRCSPLLSARQKQSAHIFRRRNRTGRSRMTQDTPPVSLIPGRDLNDTVSTAHSAFISRKKEQNYAAFSGEGRRKLFSSIARLPGGDITYKHCDTNRSKELRAQQRGDRGRKSRTQETFYIGVSFPWMRDHEVFGGDTSSGEIRELA